MTQSVRDIIHAFQTEIRDSDLTPDRAAEILTKLAALEGNCNDRIRETSFAYNKKCLDLKYESKSVAEAKMRAGTTDEWMVNEEAKDTLKLCKDLMGTLKYFLKNKFEEYNNAKYL